jgi:hypothetical protein
MYIYGKMCVYQCRISTLGGSCPIGVAATHSSDTWHMASWMVRLESLILATEGHSKPVPGWIRLVWSTSWLLAYVSTLPMSLVTAYKKDPGYRKNAGITCSCGGSSICCIRYAPSRHGQPGPPISGSKKHGWNRSCTVVSKFSLSHRFCSYTYSSQRLHLLMSLQALINPLRSLPIPSFENK